MQRRISYRGDIEFLSRTRKNPGVKSSRVLSHPKDCWSAFLSLPRCEKNNSSEASDCARPIADIGAKSPASPTHDLLGVVQPTEVPRCIDLIRQKSLGRLSTVRRQTAGFFPAI